MYIYIHTVLDHLYTVCDRLADIHVYNLTYPVVPHLFCSCSSENREPPETYCVTMANWLGSSRHAPMNWMMQGWSRRQRMETSLQNMSTSDLEQNVFARYLHTIINQLPPSQDGMIHVIFGSILSGVSPFYGNNFVPAFSSVDFSKGAYLKTIQCSVLFVSSEAC